MLGWKNGDDGIDPRGLVVVCLVNIGDLFGRSSIARRKSLRGYVLGKAGLCRNTRREKDPRR